jgi:DNA-binding response OmpR family regulator
MKERPIVLVADDEPTMRELLVRHLRTLTPPLEVIEASDGEEALRVARERLPDLVVLDVMMPEMSGWEVCKKIREDISLAHTGVVMLTGIGEKLNEMTSPLYGADAFIDKPFEFGELDEKVVGTLEARKKQRGDIPHATDSNGVIGLAKAVPRKKSAKKKTKAKAKSKAKSKSRPKKKSSPKKKSGKKSGKKAGKRKSR